MRQIAGLDHDLDARIAEAFDEVASAENALLVQLGTFDGHFDDPVRHYIEQYSKKDGPGLRALLVEPQQDAHDRLCKQYKSKHFPGVTIARVALGAEVADVPLFSKGEPKERFWSANATTVPGQLERVVRLHWLKALTSGTDEIRQEVVSAMPLEHILKDHEVDPSDITMFVTDIEGSDALAMRQLFETSADPQLIQYEHLRATHQEVSSIENELGARGYQLFSTYKDTVALKA